MEAKAKRGILSFIGEEGARGRESPEISKTESYAREKKIVYWEKIDLQKGF